MNIKISTFAIILLLIAGMLIYLLKSLSDSISHSYNTVKKKINYR